MTATFLDGQQNLAALNVPGVYVDIIPPTPFINGKPSNYEAVVGVGSWGPLNAPVPFSGPNDCAMIFGRPQVRKYDLASFIWAATQVGNNGAYLGVRVSDGTDAAATGVVASTCLTLTGKYTGTLGNKIQWRLDKGTAPGSYAFTIAFPGRAPERWNNLTGSGNALWVAIANAINNGTAVRGKSICVVASAGAGTTAPTVGASGTLSGGTDGASGVVDATLVGSDVTPRTGMYALRGTGVDCFALADLSDTTTWAAQDAFALSENAMAVLSTTSGDTISNAVATRVTAALDDMWTWLIVGDYPTFYDTENQYARLISPAAFALGLAGNLSPEQSPLNKQLRGVVATQKSQTSTVYSMAELGILEEGGCDLIVGPPTTPGGNYYSFIAGRNASSNTAARSVNYTRLTNFLARSIQGYAAGSIIGKLQSVRADDPTRNKAKSLLDGFFASIADPSVGSDGYGMIDQWSVQCDLTNNPADLQARGYLFAYCAVRYLNEVRYFVVKLAGGGNVSVTSQATQPTPSQFQ